MTKEYDLVVLGGGTGGYVAAIHAAKLGMSVAVVEADKVGGTCLHRGCIPSKALLKSAEIYREMKRAGQYGIYANELSLDFKQVQTNKKEVISTLHQGVQSLLKQAKVDVYKGFGRILGPSIFSPMPGTISVEYDNGEENTMLVPKYVLLATGSKPRALASLPYDGEQIIHSDQALEMEALPASMLIIGGGIIGIEWASLLTDLGVQVTVVEQEKDILLGEDAMVRKEIKKQLTARGVHFITGAVIDSSNVHKQTNNISIDIEHKDKTETITVEKILVSIGREANTDHIGLTNTSIEQNNGFIKTNEMYQTKEAHIYAIGDCIGGMQLAHVASHEGMIAVEHMANMQPFAMDPLSIPSCIYTHPEAAKIGLTEQAAKAQGYEIKVGKMPFQAIGKAHVNGDTAGFIKIITDALNDDILGIHFVGTHATELISEASLAKVLDANAWEIGKTIHPHPTLSEIFSEAAMAVDGKQIHG